VLGINDEVQRLGQEDPDHRNALSVRLELQADCFAGIWAHSAFQRDLLSDGDLEEGITAAGAVGDDRLGAQSPESFTHGTSEQRVRWLRTGYETGDLEQCDTFSIDESDL
jgi:predicted metalloprotease